MPDGLRDHALLRAQGARARWRTLHELAVVSAILGTGDDELSERLLLHAAAEAYEDARLHEKHRSRTGREPLSPDEVGSCPERLTKPSIYKAAV